MRIPLALLQQRFMDPDGFKNAMENWLLANNVKIEIKKVIAEMNLFHQKTIAALSRQQYFTGTFDVNATNIRNNTFIRPDSEPMIVTAIGLRDGQAGTLEDTDWVDGVSLAVVKNATMTAEINGETVLRNFPLAAASDERTDFSRGVIELSEPVLWMPQTPAEVNVQFNAGSTAPVAGDNLRVELRGIGLIS